MSDEARLQPLILESQGPKPKRKRTTKPRRDPATVEIVTKVVDAFNEMLGRKLTPLTYYADVKKCLDAGYEDEHMRAVMWWSQFEYDDDHPYRTKLTPHTLLHLKPSQAGRCMAVHLDLATELWPTIYPGEPIPWKKKE